jgi:hypothetical protein
MELLLSDKKGNSRRIKHFWHVRETLATKRNIGNLRNQITVIVTVTIETLVLLVTRVTKNQW